MRRAIALAAVALATANQSAAAPYVWTPNWTVGQEREVDAGIYAKLYARQQGWSIWRFETEDGVSCDAVKPAIGKAQVYPIGAGLLLGGPGTTPSIDVTTAHGAEDELRMILYGRWSSSRVEEYRLAGEKFFSALRNFNVSPAEAEGMKFEVHIETWQYPELRLGLANEYGTVDLTGVQWALQQKSKCDPKTSAP